MLKYQLYKLHYLAFALKGECCKQGHQKMNYEIFETLLKQAKVNKKEFANLVEMNYTSITNWKNTDNVPKWVKSWLQNYIKAKSYKDIKDKVFEIEGK